jgi:hypothetical protein
MSLTKVCAILKLSIGIFRQLHLNHCCCVIMPSLLPHHHCYVIATLCLCHYCAIVVVFLCCYGFIATILLLEELHHYVFLNFQHTIAIVFLCYYGFITTILLLEELHHNISSTSNVFAMNYYNLVAKLFIFCFLQFEFFFWFFNYQDLHCDYVGQSKLLLLHHHLLCPHCY